MHSPTRHARIATPISALALTALVDVLFYGHPVGCGPALFAAALIAVIIARCGRSRRTAPIWVLAGYAMLLACALLDHPGTIALILSAIALPMLGLASRRAWIPDAWYWTRELSRWVLAGWTRLFRDIPRLEKPSIPILRTLRLVGRWIIPIGLTAGFLILFSIANPVMAQALTRFLTAAQEWIEKWLTLPPWQRVLFWMATLVLLWALLRSRPRRADTQPVSPPPLPNSGFAADSIVRCLLLFNLAFAAQNIMDACYLWGGATLPAGMTYAAYAHRGAYPLVVTALLAAVFVLVTFAPGRATVRHRRARAWVFAWIAQNILLTLSASWRLHLYIETYGLTRLRLAAVLWMLLVAGGLVLICWRIVRERSNGWLLNMNAAQLIAVLTICAFASVDARIAWHNARYCREAGGPGPCFDFTYARVHGEAALPALRWLLANSHEDAARWRAGAAVQQLESQLDAATVDWRGWTLSRLRLKSARQEKR